MKVNKIWISLFKKLLWTKKFIQTIFYTKTLFKTTYLIIMFSLLQKHNFEQHMMKIMHIRPKHPQGGIMQPCHRLPLYIADLILKRLQNGDIPFTLRRRIPNLGADTQQHAHARQIGQWEENAIFKFGFADGVRHFLAVFEEGVHDAQ